MPKLSIIVPVYNTDKFIKKCINSILNQPFDDFELLLIDDGSIDGSNEICNYYACMDARVRVVSKRNSGVSSTRNVGLDIALGEYVSFIDSDDWIEEDFYEKMLLGKFRSYDLYICGVYLNYTEETDIEQNIYRKTFELNPMQTIEMMMSSSYFNGYQCNKIFNLKVIKDIGLCFNQEIVYCEDMLFVAEYIMRCNSAFYYSYPLYHYRVRAGNATSGKNHLGVYTGIKAHNSILDLYRNYPSETREVIKANCAQMSIRAVECMVGDRVIDKKHLHLYQNIFKEHEDAFFKLKKGKIILKGRLFKLSPYLLYLYFLIKKKCFCNIARTDNH